MNFYKYIEEKAKLEGIQKIITGAIITNEKDEILLLKRKADDFMGGIYEIPGGNSEKGENILQTLIREVKEETNLDVSDVKSYVDYFEYISESGKKCRQFNFVVKVNPGQVLLTEHENYKWIKLNEIEEEKQISAELKNTLILYKFNVRKNKI